MADASEHPIVVGVDGSASARRALDWAVRQADLTAARLDVVITWEWPGGFGWTVPFPEDWDPQADAQKAVDEALLPARQAHPDVMIQTLVVEGHAAPVLVDASRQAALLVVGSRGHGNSPACCSDRSASIASPTPIARWWLCGMTKRTKDQRRLLPPKPSDRSGAFDSWPAGFGVRLDCTRTAYSLARRHSWLARSLEGQHQAAADAKWLVACLLIT